MTPLQRLGPHQTPLGPTPCRRRQRHRHSVRRAPPLGAVRSFSRQPAILGVMKRGTSPEPTRLLRAIRRLTMGLRRDEPRIKIASRRNRHMVMKKSSQGAIMTRQWVVAATVLSVVSHNQWREG